MLTSHNFFFKNAQNMKELADESVDLIVTSPPYPMIEMWDETFFQMNHEIKEFFDKKDFYTAFESMHEELDKVWRECFRVLKNGGIAVVNIGDATRTLEGNFQLFTNHVKIVENMQRLGMQSLPAIIWRKTSNKPNKFMGSGMLPVNAYVTLEHEYILVFKKGGKRVFNAKDAQKRRESAFFWEERNIWFSDVWNDIVGQTQKIDESFQIKRERNAAFPLELAMRIINMFSIYEDVVLDPFLGTGTTSFACAILGRNSIGYEIDRSLEGLIKSRFKEVQKYAKSYLTDRIDAHKKFIAEYTIKSGKELKHYNKNIKFPVMTSQEQNIQFYLPQKVDEINTAVVCEYEKFVPQSLLFDSLILSQIT